MTGLEFLEKMNDIDSEFIEKSEAYQKKSKVLWIRWAVAAAACVILVSVGIFAKTFSNNKSAISTENAFVFNNMSYELASMEKLVEYGIVTEQSRFCSEDDGYVATKMDCGKQIGTLRITLNGEKKECKVYKHSKVDDANICVIEYPNEEYKIYVIKEDSDEM